MSWCRGAFWVPGEALVLTGLTIQILGYIEAQNINVTEKKREIQSLVESQLSIDCARVTMCVFVGFLLPRMASASSGTRWSNILALLISISTHISTEVYVIHNAKDVRPLKEERVSWFIGSGGVLLLSIIGLIVLLGYVVIAGKFISENLSRRIPHSLSEDKYSIDEDKSENVEEAQKRFEYEILRTWVVTRVCQPEYVIARSMFSAATGGIVTCCVALFVVKVILLRSLVNRVPLFSLQCVFILIGWTFIFYRWWTSVIYFREVKESWHNSRHVFLAGVSRYFQLQEIIFGFTVYDLMGVKNSVVFLKFRKSKCYHKIKVYLKSLGTVIKVLISAFLVAPWLAFYFTTASVTIFMSMFFWALMALLCRNKCMLFLCKFRKKMWLSVDSDEDLKRYKNVLESVVIYGEDPVSLWTANRSTFKNIKSSMGRAFDTGKDCKELINLMRYSNSELNFLDHITHFKEMLKYFPGVNEQPWRMIALSLVKMIIEVGDSFPPDDEQSNSIVQEAVLAYKQARDLMDFSDCPDNVHVNAESFSTSNMEAFLLRYKAEREFRALKKMYRHWKFGRQVNHEDDSVVEALDKCTPKLFECSACIKNQFKRSLYSRMLAKNSKNPCESIYSATFKHFESLDKKVRMGCACWEDVASTYSLLQVSKFIKEQEIGDSQLLLDFLRSFLANVVCQSLSGLLEKVVESCNIWAAHFEEEKISKAIDIAGKAWAVMEESRARAFGTVQFTFGEIDSLV
ncbi:hypothetical protein SUGI_0079260 [Cryptomeria japonica]|nr:hypothetical protein SUGI_0079260 [Cryptomeria japonica]